MTVNLCESVCDRKPFENEVQVRKFMVLRDEFVVDRLEGLMAALELTRISCKSETHSVEGPSQHVHLLGGESRFVDFDFTLAPGEPCRGFGKCAKRSDDGTRDPVGDEADDEYDREIEPGYAADRNDDRCERFLVVLFENQGPAEASQGDLGPHDAHVLDIVVMSDLQTGGYRDLQALRVRRSVCPGRVQRVDTGSACRDRGGRRSPFRRGHASEALAREGRD